MLPDRGALAFLAPSNSLLSRRRLIVTETLSLSFRRNQLPRCLSLRCDFSLSFSRIPPGYFPESNSAILCRLSMILERDIAVEYMVHLYVAKIRMGLVLRLFALRMHVRERKQ